MLARLFARPANVLVLDEPTNDLDIETLELLEELIGGVRRHGAARQPRPRVPRQHRHQHAGVRRGRPACGSTSAGGRTISGSPRVRRTGRSRVAGRKSAGPVSGGPRSGGRGPQAGRSPRGASCPTTSGASSTRCRRGSRRSRPSSAALSAEMESRRLLQVGRRAHRRGHDAAGESSARSSRRCWRDGWSWTSGPDARLRQCSVLVPPCSRTGQHAVFVSNLAREILRHFSHDRSAVRVAFHLLCPRAAGPYASNIEQCAGGSFRVIRVAGTTCRGMPIAIGGPTSGSWRTSSSG